MCTPSKVDGYAVAKYVNEARCFVHEHGTAGRVQRADDNQCVLYDMVVWSDDMAQCVKDRFVGCHINVQHTTSSITGFAVVIGVQHVYPSNLMPILLCFMMVLLFPLVWWMGV
jgi:hypothetical protein